MLFIRKYTIASPKIGFIGLGKMGNPMSRKLVEKFKDIIVYDKDINARESYKGGASVVADFPSFENCDVIFTMLPDAKSTEDALLSDHGLLKWIKKGTTIVNSGTIGVSESVEIMKKIGPDYEFVDAPVSGGTIGAEKGTLTFMVGSNESAFKKIEHIISAMGENIYFIGEVGKGQAVKICNNMLLAIIMIGTSEAFALAKKLDLDMKLFNDIISISSGRSWVTEVNNPVPLLNESSPSSKNYEGGFSSKLLLKDIRLALEASREQNLNLPVLKTSDDIYSKMIDTDLAAKSKDMSYVFQHILNQKNNKP